MQYSKIAYASKSGSHLFAILEEIVYQNPIVGSDMICIHKATSENEPTTAIAMDLLTNFVGSIRCVVHTLDLVAKDVF